ncbi:hypothetical protein BH10BAC4_BH10BAC4_18010 [soil metagenome]
MLLERLFKRETEKDHFLYAKKADELSIIQSAGMNIVILERNVNDDLKTSVQSITDSSFESISISARVGVDARTMIREEMEKTCTNCIPLLDDMMIWFRLFASISRSNRIQLHLKLVNDDGCTRFHVDRYALRLLCTYSGPGTEWTYDNNVNRAHLGSGDKDKIIYDWDKINRLQAMDVAILKGEVETDVKGIVHRSPPLRQEGEKRLVFRLDY